METPVLNAQKQIEAFFYISDLLSEMTDEALRNDDIELSEKIKKENKKVLSKISVLMNNKNQN